MFYVPLPCCFALHLLSCAFIAYNLPVFWKHEKHKLFYFICVNWNCIGMFKMKEHCTNECMRSCNIIPEYALFNTV